ncbi:hypothetical protein MASR2M70_19230 [Bacillota bacterium]
MELNHLCKKIGLVDHNSGAVIISTDINIIGSRIILHGANFPLIDRNAVVSLTGYCDEGLVEMQGSITLSIGEQINIDVNNIDEINDRRSFLKVRCDAEATILSAYLDNRKKKVFAKNDGIRLRDISAGGMCFFSDQIYFVKHRLLIDLHGAAPDLKVNAVILRKQREYRAVGFRYRYACKFVGLNRIDERKIMEYTFKMELENHRKKQEFDMYD